MKALIIRKILFICLNNDDLDSVKKGTSINARYDAEHKIHVHLFPDHLTIVDEEWMLSQKDPEIKFSTENNDFDLWLSLFDVKAAFISVLHVPDHLVPENPAIDGVKIFFPDSTVTGYPKDERLYSYAYPELHELEAA